jgi:hypothetical protein
MKKLLLASLLALPFLALAAPVQANPTIYFSMPVGPDKIDAGFNVHLRMLHGNAPGQAGPWYLYWPMEAHFQQPAPTGFPFWPGPMSLPGDSHGHASQYPSFVPQPTHVQAPVQPNPVRPVNYQTTMPSYWYPR